MPYRASWTAVFLVAFGTPVLAQSNEVFLGQIGEANTVKIEQTGSLNVVGANSDDRRLNQIGSGNTITIEQVGDGNRIGPLNLVNRPGFLTGTDGVAAGLNQLGTANSLTIEQRSARQAGGGSLIGAISQTTAGAVSAQGGNTASVVQIGGAYDPSDSTLGVSTGPAFHEIYELSQDFVAQADAAGRNVLRVEQVGTSQTVWQVRQRGASNDLFLSQSVRGNAVRLARQDGTVNSMSLVLSGLSNTLGIVNQIGDGNQADVSVSGERNFVDQVRQTGFSVGAGGGNIARVTIVGNDNGGETIGGYRAMSAQGSTLAGYAAAIEQTGDDNLLVLTIGSDLAGGGSNGNMFSLVQTGDANFLTSVMSGDDNELRSFQDGEGNIIDVVQTSQARFGGRAAGTSDARLGNLASLRTDGDGNTVALSQDGTTNSAAVTVFGNDNDMGSRVAGGAVRTAGVSRTVFLPSGLLQSGSGNDLMATLTGDRNRFGLVQLGAGNQADLTIVGSDNQAAIDQMGDGYAASVTQLGMANMTAVMQTRAVIAP
ncbi:hypothetical protein U0C82_03990 [Fulvimarina sp. 2208YS6-2-32]|uniref:Curlin associated repeat-containing protein n=1 Tax=Fulvimarina uroteuthidis TaxID=3098149 RepID=A0ABU5HZC2_9HYPH|nr:hypothetical protein [Fulvimarina sp. 2208YS6-2-32]MDY8108311.1 hypothetical protein [Fulvimarina sp. 2208YS6-2-32]